VFDFDADLTLGAIHFAGLEDGDTMKVTIFDGSNGGAGAVRTVTDTDKLVIEEKLTAGIDIRIEQVTGKSRIKSISVAEPSQ